MRIAGDGPFLERIPSNPISDNRRLDRPADSYFVDTSEATLVLPDHFSAHSPHSRENRTIKRKINILSPQYSRITINVC